MTCETVAKQLPLILYGELSFDEEEAIHHHLEQCCACRSEMERVRAVHAEFDRLEPDLPAQLLQNNRRNLRMAVATLGNANTSPGDSRFGFLHRFWPLVWKPAGAFALLVLGFVAGRYGSAIGGGARVEEPVASRVRYVQPDDTGRVQIVVEEVRQRVLEGGVNEGRIQALLVSAAREANDPGVRVDTMDLLKQNIASVEVRRALLAALQHDTNPGVRLKAMEALRSSVQDTETRRVLAQVLLTDENPGIRTQAVDLLTQTHEPAIVGVLQELMTREDNNYVRLKCQRALNDMNASVETF
jgi:hypothetical protein